jgi:protein-L-isoaspartate(D-aspartate) O-methyltransferase
MEPMVIARLIQLAAPRPGDTALVVASGAGYGAAVLAACGVAVTALEEDEALFAMAQAVLPELAPEVRPVRGPLAEGWKAAAPYDLILIEGAVEFVPDAIVRQLNRPPAKAMGRLVTVLCAGGRICHGAIGEPVATGADHVAMRFQPVFDCATPVLPALRKPAGFVF